MTEADQGRRGMSKREPEQKTGETETGGDHRRTGDTRTGSKIED